MVDDGSSVRLLSDLVRVAGRDQANLSPADVATAAHVARGYVHEDNEMMRPYFIGPNPPTASGA
jgi:hypothetical protein